MIALSLGSLTPAGKVVADYAARIMADEQNMMIQAIETDRRERILTLSSCSLLAINRITPNLNQAFRDKSILTEINTDDNIARQLHNRTCQLGIFHSKIEDKSLFLQSYISEQIYISVPRDHPLSSKKYLKQKDLEGLGILTFDIGFWVNLCRSKMPKTAFHVQTDVDAMDELVHASTLLVFNSDRMLEDGYTAGDRVNIPLTEPFAKATYYIGCLDSEKQKYGSLFNSLRSELIK